MSASWSRRRQPSPDRPDSLSASTVTTTTVHLVGKLIAARHSARAGGAIRQHVSAGSPTFVRVTLRRSLNSTVASRSSTKSHDTTSRAIRRSRRGKPPTGGSRSPSRPSPARSRAPQRLERSSRSSLRRSVRSSRAPSPGRLVRRRPAGHRHRSRVHPAQLSSQRRRGGGPSAPAIATISAGIPRSESHRALAEAAAAISAARRSFVPPARVLLARARQLERGEPVGGCGVAAIAPKITSLRSVSAGASASGVRRASDRRLSELALEVGECRERVRLEQREAQLAADARPAEGFQRCASASAAVRAPP